MNNASKMQQLLHGCFGHIRLATEPHKPSQGDSRLKNIPEAGVIYVALWQLEGI